MIHSAGGQTRASGSRRPVSRSTRDRFGRKTRPRRTVARVGLALVCAVGLGLAGPAAADAATELGFLPTDDQLESCGAPGAAGLDVVQATASPDVPYAVPPGGGVITSWRHRSAPTPSMIRLQAWRPAGGTAYTLEGRSEVETASSGVAATAVSEFEARIPVSEGSLLGLRAVSVASCISDNVFSTADDALGRSPGADPVPGETVTMNSPSGAGALRRVNVAATLEPDADGDGFGDESQDVELTVKLKNKLRPKRAGFPVKVSCGGSECEGTIKGKAIATQTRGSGAAAAKKKSFKLKKKELSIEAGETKKTKLKLKRNKSSSKKLGRLLKGTTRGSKLTLTVNATNSLGAADKLKDKAKLKP